MENRKVKHHWRWSLKTESSSTQAIIIISSASMHYQNTVMNVIFIPCRYLSTYIRLKLVSACLHCRLPCILDNAFSRVYGNTVKSMTSIHMMRPLVTMRNIQKNCWYKSLKLLLNQSPQPYPPLSASLDSTRWPKVWLIERHHPK